MTPTASTARFATLSSENPAENTTHLIASNLRHNLPALGIQIPRIFVEDREGTRIDEESVLALDQGAGTSPAKWMIEIGSGDVHNAADVARKVNAVQRVEDSPQAFSAMMNLICELGNFTMPAAEDELLRSGVVRQAVVSHLRSINLQGVGPV